MTTANSSGGGSAKDFSLETLLTLIEDYHSFNPDTTVPTYEYPTHLEFSQQVARGRPCVYRLDRSVLDDRAVSGASEVEDGNYGNGNGNDNDNSGGEIAKVSSPRITVKSIQRQRLRDEQRSILSAPCFAWTKKSLCELVQGEVEVAVTPDGRADALYSLPRRTRTQSHPQREADGDELEQVFLQPASTYMTLSTLIDKLCPPLEPSQSSSHLPPSACSPSSPPQYQSTSTSASTATAMTTTEPAHYLQSQNSNLHTPPLSSLLASLPPTPPPFSAAVLGDPEAVNIWIGNARSVTSTHRDPYENLYVVVKGRKRFVLYSPVEEVCLHAQKVRTGRWVLSDSQRQKKETEFTIVMDDDDDDDDDNTTTTTTSDPNSGDDADMNRIPWIPIDPLSPPSAAASQKYPYYKYTRPLTVTVSEGEILYLPAGWFHHVTQECGLWESDDGSPTTAPCIAVNYWFDMDYSGEKHVMREMVGRLVEKIRMSENT
ncbi:hypothetical protein Z517_00211 [Fonsecaea pedrosoi CBS 271.37]|uniref:JmjC domain-containing protein n=1 Tax=Fonsecaea pedrosoi CBS 271.37 TaxID=1442368 RepID=A0A0D2GV06_9EURO|nr:uncharacterized protein Z517_00211 [Fonsecaea pedrosoi CBS 271.37]KIW84823.1 hypothetical protein Z517_00211 [Fonsecaea pedrosoi CBS 271.37]